MQLIKWVFISVMTAGLMVAMPINSDVKHVEAGGGPPGHGHEKAKDDHDKERKGDGNVVGSPSMGHMEKGSDQAPRHAEMGHDGQGSSSMGHMKTGGHGDNGHRDEGQGHGGMGSPKGLSKIETKGFKLISDLHCNACHYIAPELSHGAGHSAGHGAVAPDLTFLGDKFRSEWLYEFIRKPHMVRPWLKIRMPNFRLSDSEAVSLVKHLTKDMRAPFLPPIPDVTIPLSERKAYIEAGRKLMSEEYFSCWSCHQQGRKTPEGPMENWATDFQISSKRLRPGWVVRWLQNPQKLMPGTKMPAFFEDAESGPDDILGGDEWKQIIAISEYLFSLDGGSGISGPDSLGLVSQQIPVERPAALLSKKLPNFALVEKKHPRTSRARGAQLMSELNCAGCHDVGNMHEREEAGPPLAHEGSRVRKEWLVRFLKKPHRIRPNGYLAGAASRMPEFRLSHKEANAIAAFLMTRTDKRMHAHDRAHNLDMAKVKRGKRLFASLRCGACHQTETKGRREVSVGFAGPPLSRAGKRLKDDHLQLFLGGNVTKSGSKLEMDAHPLIPKMGLTKKQIEELSAYVMTLR